MELCEILLKCISSNASTRSTTNSFIRYDSAQKLIRAISKSIVNLLNRKIFQMEQMQSSRKTLVTTRSSLKQILDSDESFSPTKSSFKLDVLTNQESNSIVGVAAVIGSLSFKVKLLFNASFDPKQEIINDADFIQFIRNCQFSLEKFHREVRREVLPNDLKFYHSKIQNIDMILTWWLATPFPIGEEFIFNSTIHSSFNEKTFEKACCNII